jgi:hypothetical protein
MKNIGTILIMAGILMLALAGFSHVSKNQTVSRPGEIKPPAARNAPDNDPLLWSPILGTGLFVAGILVIVLVKK